jgi:hypothetical protein
MKTSRVLIATLGLATSLLGSFAQASTPPTGQQSGVSVQTIASAAKLGVSGKAEASGKSGAVQVACYWYRTQENLPCR